MHASHRPIAFTGVKNYFYALSNVGRDKTALVEINAEDGKEQKLVLGCDKADISAVDYSKDKHRIDLATCDEAKPKKHFLNEDITHIYDQLSQHLHGTEINIISRDSAEDKLIVSTYTDRNPGTYYLYERSTGKLTKL